MEAERSEKQLLKSNDLTPLLWILLAIATRWATEHVSLWFFGDFLSFEAALKESLATISASITLYTILSMPIWRDRAVNFATYGNPQLGIRIKMLMISLAMIIPLGVNFLFFNLKCNIIIGN